MDTIGVLYNPRLADAEALASKIAGWLRDRGVEAHIDSNEAADDALPWLERAGLVVAVGGDGSLLRVAHLAAPHGIPIIGINMGRVGFLTEIEPDNWQNVLSQVIEDKYWIESRMMLCAYLHRDGDLICQAEALNEVMIGRGARAHLVRLDTEVDGGRLATYVADGLIVATPTGSTAYALAAGGPIMPPELHNILLVPVAPHLSMNRPVVLSEGVKVRITVADEYGAVLTVDGGVEAELEKGDDVIVAASANMAHFARVRERTYFYKTLLARLVPRN